MIARVRALLLPLALASVGGVSATAAQEDVGAGSGQPLNAALAACDRARFRVALDVGHTVEQPGALSARGMPEFVFNLLLAERIERALRAAGFDRTRLLVTDGAAKPSLFMRVSHATDIEADLFLSIHHDAVPQPLKETWEYEGRQLEYSDRFRGHSIFVSYDHAQARASLAFARLLGLAMKARGLAYTPHYTEPFMGPRRRQLVDAEAGVYRFDALVVLRRTRMPAVLLEGGMIVHREEELALAAPERQELVSAAVVEAVERYCATEASELSALRRARPAARTRPLVRRPAILGSGIPVLPGRD